MKSRTWQAIVVLSILVGIVSAEPLVEFSPSPGAVNVRIDGKPFTQYLYEIDPAKPMAADGVLLTKPVLYPLVTPSGIVVTRGWPFEKIEGEKRDHPHHIGLYFTYDEINGNNFWNNSKNPLPAIEHLRAELTTDAAGRPALETHSKWIGKGDVPLLAEKRVTSFSTGTDEYIIDIDIELTALAEKVTFGDTKEGMFAVRLAQWLTESTDSKYQRGTGSYLSSNGDEKESGVWGKRAKWVRIQGQKDGKTVGIAILNHPSSTNYPTYWHARGYGAFSANPLGQYAFQRSRRVENPKPFGLTLEQGQTAGFKFRVVIYDGPRTKEQLDEAFAEYVK